MKIHAVIFLTLLGIGSIVRAEPEYVLVEDRGDRACEEAISLLQRSGIDLSATEMLEIRAQKSCQQKVTQKIILSNVANGTSDKVGPASPVGLVIEVPKLKGTQLGEKSSWDEISMALRKLGLLGGEIYDVPMALLKPSGASGVRLRVQQIVSIPDSEIPLQKKPPLGLLIEIPINL